MTEERDADNDLAPVIPLFGGARGGGRHGGAAGTSPRHPTRRVASDAEPGSVAPDASGASAEAGERWHTTWRDLGTDLPPLRPAPELATETRDGVRFVQLPDRAAADAHERTEHGTRDARRRPDADPTDVVARSERRLVRVLGTRGLSVSEARTRLRQEEVPADAVEEILDRLQRMGALDDARLAEQLVYAAVTRKKQGRRAIAQALSARGIPRDVVDAALEAFPDDDAERALEFARTKARQLSRYDDDTALRRLVGQLARRGFGGSLAMSAARRALDEARSPASRVRFD